MAITANDKSFRLTVSHLYVAVAVLVNLAGWGLSLIGQLNGLGYSAVLAVAAIGGLLWARRGGVVRLRLRADRLRRRFRRPLPFCFGVITLLALLGGLLHPPNNYDALSYRIPRILNWLAEGRWHWIHTQDPRMNAHACGSEWLVAPWIALTGTDRWIFLINVAGYLLLPGLVFSVFRGLGVSPRVAWSWMWLLPTGYNFILQMGGSANDLLGAVYALAALFFALRARHLHSAAEAWFALLAMALLSGAKLSNLPLLLPLGLALLPAWRLLAARPAGTLVVLAITISVSAVPMCLHNIQHGGGWSGLALERTAGQTQTPIGGLAFKANDPLIGISGNALILLAGNFLPPVLPLASWWNAHVQSFLPAGYRAKLIASFGPNVLHLRELQGEETAGLGFGVCWLLVLGVIGAWFYSQKQRLVRAPPKRSAFEFVVLVSVFVALAAFMAECSIEAAARIVAPYYALLAPAFLLGQGQEWVVRSGWWRGCAWAVCLLAAALLVIIPERPLWPSQKILGALEKRKPANAMIQRALTVYSVYADRYDALAPLREYVPPNVSAIGILCYLNEAPTSLWRPFGHKRVRQVLLTDTRSDLKGWEVQYILARDFGPRMDPWLQAIGGEVIGTQSVRLYAGEEPATWYVVHVREGQP